MDIKQIESYYSPLAQADVDALSDLVRRVGLAPVIATLADIITQGPQRTAAGQADLSFCLGGAIAASLKVDRECPPAGASGPGGERHVETALAACGGK